MTQPSLFARRSGDLFAGGGGASEGIARATGIPPLFAVNHDPEAIAMHARNHPGVLHLCESVYDVDPFLPGGLPLDLLWASPDCFPAGTTVLTERGYVPIETVQVGDQVLTHRGRWRRVTSTMRSTKRTKVIRGHGHPGLRVSEEHPFLVSETMHTWDNDSRSYLRTASKAEWVPTKELRPLASGVGGVPEGHYWCTPTRFPVLDIPKVGGRGMPLNPDLLWLAGLYVADGWSRLTRIRAELVIICGHHEASERRGHLDRWPRGGARAGHGELAWHQRDAGTATQFSTSHRGLVRWLREHFGHLAHQKRVPAWLLGAPLELRQAFLEGYLLGDGHERKGIVEATTVSRGLVFGLRSLVASLGGVAAVYVGANSSVIDGRDVQARPSWRIRWRAALDPQHAQHFERDERLFTPIREVRHGDVETVYNLSVEEDESYVADSIIVHNCTHFSRAKGGKPRSKAIRSLAWVVVDWAQKVRPRVICVENVSEFRTWGPLNDRGRPIKARAGETFQRWVHALRSLGYAVEWRELVAADYGAPTTRRRLFIVARCDGRAIGWPEPTHGPGCPRPHRAAAECIDWSIPCPSIFTRKRPLAEKTQARVAAGLVRYVLEAERPFIVGDRAWWLQQSGYGERKGQRPRVLDIEAPLGTVVAGGSKHALCSAWLAKHYTGVVGSGMRKPLGTITAKDHHSLCTASVARGGDSRRVAAFLTKYYGSGSQGQALTEPLHTIVSKARFGLVTVTIDGEDYAVTDIGLRMLQPRELARAQGFGDDYVLEGTKTSQIARIGNSVPPPVVEALVRAQFGDRREGAARAA